MTFLQTIGLSIGRACQDSEPANEMIKYVFGCCYQQANILKGKIFCKKQFANSIAWTYTMYFLSVFTFTLNCFQFLNLPYILTPEIIQNVMLSCEALFFSRLQITQIMFSSPLPN